MVNGGGGAADLCRIGVEPRTRRPGGEGVWGEGVTECGVKGGIGNDGRLGGYGWGVGRWGWGGRALRGGGEAGCGRGD